METQKDLRFTSFTNTLPAIGLLLFSWLVSFLLLMAITEGWGSPWDTTRIRPPIGHWQRTLNDFFESGMGAYLPASIFFCINWLLISVKVRTKGIVIASSALAITNLMALFAMFIAIIIGQAFIPDAPAHLTPADWESWGDFRREWPVSLAILLWFIGVVIWQPKVVDIVSERIRRAS